MKTRKFVDSAVLYATGGRGGDGCVSFRREKFVPKGGPDGGDGGQGGSVILQADRDSDSLIHIYFQPHRKADRGGHGKGKKLYGRGGADIIIKVPCGTEVHERESEALLGDIVEHGQQLVIARGGKGGRGNCHWASSTNQAPREHTDGEPGEEVALRLELKLLADGGLVGFPNAGKSSLLSRISDAHPRIGAYPFTTLNPVIGTLVFDDYARMTVADIPGLITGAHDGVGLGDDFLRHIERSRYIIFVLDMAGIDGRQPHEDYQAVRNELKLYDASMIERPYMIVANKMDCAEAGENLAIFEKETGESPIPVSAETGQGIDRLREALHRVATLPD